MRDCTNRLIEYVKGVPNGIMSLEGAERDLGVKRGVLKSVLGVLMGIGVVKRIGEVKYQWVEEEMKRCLNRVEEKMDTVGEGKEEGRWEKEN